MKICMKVVGSKTNVVTFLFFSIPISKQIYGRKIVTALRRSRGTETPLSLIALANSLIKLQYMKYVNEVHAKNSKLLINILF